DHHDAEQLYRMLEQEAVPLFYQRDLDGIPRGWLQLVKESIRTIAPQFCTKRMVKDYVETLYRPAMTRTPSIWGDWSAPRGTLESSVSRNSRSFHADLPFLHSVRLRLSTCHRRRVGFILGTEGS